MNSKAELKKLERSFATIQAIARVFQETTIKRFKVNQDELLRINAYSANGLEIYKRARYNFLKLKNDEISSKTLRVTLRDKALVLVTAEKQYYGSLLGGVVNLFINEYQKHDSDVFVLGKKGWDILLSKGINDPKIKFYNLNDDQPDLKAIKSLLSEIFTYKKIMLFYGHYESTFHQDAKALDIVENINFTSAPKTFKKYIFSDKSPFSLGLLEQQLISSSFLSKLYESGMAKFGYRTKVLQIGIVAQKLFEMEEMLGKFKVQISKKNKNRKQNELFSTSSFWEKPDISSLV